MTVRGALKSSRWTTLSDVERRINGGIGIPFRWSAAPSSTGRGRFGGRGKSGFSILASLCSAKYLTTPRVTIRNLTRLFRLGNRFGTVAPRPPSSEPTGPRSLSLEFQKTRKSYADPGPSVRKGRSMGLPRLNDGLRFFLSQRIFLTRNFWLLGAATVVSSQEQT